MAFFWKVHFIQKWSVTQDTVFQEVAQILQIVQKDVKEDIHEEEEWYLPDEGP